MVFSASPTTVRAAPTKALRHSQQVLLCSLFVNDSEEVAAVDFMRHTGDKTIQDVIDYYGEEPFSVHHPLWSNELGTYESIESGKSLCWEDDLMPKIHHMVCAGFKQGIWFGTGLTVEE
jgi:hypothetical protein